jgi:hypothetical protein
MNTKLFLVTISFIVTSLSVKAQLNIGSASAPDPSAALQVSSNNLGFRLPQISLTSTTIYLTVSGSVATAQPGMMVYNTNASIAPGTYSVNGLTATAQPYPGGIGVYTWNGTFWAPASVSYQTIFSGCNGLEAIGASGVTVSAASSTNNSAIIKTVSFTVPQKMLVSFRYVIPYTTIGSPTSVVAYGAYMLFSSVPTGGPSTTDRFMKNIQMLPPNTPTAAILGLSAYTSIVLMPGAYTVTLIGNVANGAGGVATCQFGGAAGNNISTFDISGETVN